MAENGYGNQQAKKGGLEAVNAFREKFKNTFTGKTPKARQGSQGSCIWA